MVSIRTDGFCKTLYIITQHVLCPNTNIKSLLSTRSFAAFGESGLGPQFECLLVATYETLVQIRCTSTCTQYSMHSSAWIPTTIYPVLARTPRYATCACAMVSNNMTESQVSATLTLPLPTLSSSILDS